MPTELDEFRAVAIHYPPIDFGHGDSEEFRSELLVFQGFGIARHKAELKVS
jgi:hypothetical protein